MKFENNTHSNVVTMISMDWRTAFEKIGTICYLISQPMQYDSFQKINKR